MKKILSCLILVLLFTVAANAEDNIVFTFNTQQDIDANIEERTGMSVTLDGGYVKLTNTTSDPYMYLPVADLHIDTSAYKYMKLRFKCTQKQNENLTFQIFIKTDTSGNMGAVGSYVNYTYSNTGDFIELEIDLSTMSLYKGTLQKLRFDPTTSTEKLNIYLDYIALFDHKIKMERYPEIVTDEDIQDIIDAEQEANRIKVTRTEKPEKLVYPLRSYNDYNKFTDYEHAQRKTFNSFGVTLLNYNNDPHIRHDLTQEEYFYADDLPFMKIRFKPINNTGKKRTAQFFFTTDVHSMGATGTHTGITFTENGQWQEHIIDLKNDISASCWSDIVIAVRYDHTTSADEVPIIPEYIGFFPTRTAAEEFALPSLLPKENSDTVTVYSGNNKVIIPSDTISERDTAENYIIMSAAPENTDKIIGGAVVQYTDNNGNQSIVALSHDNTDIVTYVANKPGTYSLTYNTKKYEDISGHWGYAEIMFASNRNLFGGTSSEQFNPDMPITRGMFITVLGRMQGIDTSLYSSAPDFSDVNPSEYYSPYIKWATQIGIAEGENNNFMPEEPISRSDMALYIANYMEYYDYTFENVADAYEFSDIASLGENVRDAIKTIQSAGIINGKDNSIFDPDAISTRAEGAAVISRLVKAILGLEIDFFETSERSMEFKHLPADRLRFGAYIPHPGNIAVLDENHIRTVSEAGIDFTVLVDWHRNHMIDRMSRWYERYGIEYVYQGMDAQKYASDGRTRIFDKDNAQKLAPFEDTIPFAGLALVDEPGVAMFPEIGQSVKDFYELYPDEIPFINLLPLYANEAQLTEGAWADKIEYYEGVPATYKTYLEEYVKQVPTPFICVDIYPCSANKRTYKDYAKAIEFVADACRNSGRDLWIFNQCCFWGSPQYVIDETDIYWQGYTVLSFGAKTILYYIFSALSGHYDTPLDDDGKPNDTYYAMKKFHEELRRFDEVYLSYDNLGVFSLNTQNAPWAQLNNPYTQFDVITEINAAQPLIVGCFESKDKKSHAFTLVNHSDRSNPKSDNITFKVNANTVTAYIDGYPTRLVPNSDGYYTVTLDCGRGVFMTAK